MDGIAAQDEISWLTNAFAEAQANPEGLSEEESVKRYIEVMEEISRAHRKGIWREMRLSSTSGHLLYPGCFFSKHDRAPCVVSMKSGHMTLTPDNDRRLSQDR
jgi:hypothetical protein